MKIIPFEPGDGTRYHVGIEHITDQGSLYLLGRPTQECSLFYFGTTNWACAAVIGHHVYGPQVFVDVMKLSGWTAVAAYIVFQFLTKQEVEVVRCEQVLRRWEEDNGKDWWEEEDNDKHWKMQLLPIVHK